MKDYELAVVFDPHFETDQTKANQKIEKIINDSGGKITKTDNWGKRKLAYQINKHDQGVYVIYTVQLPAESIQGIESTLNITDEVIRYLLSKVNHKSIAKADAARKEKAAKVRSSEANDDLEDEQEKEGE